MTRKDLGVAAGLTALTMLLYSLYASDRRICFDSPCGTIENVVHFLFDEAWLIGLFAFPLSLLALWAWHRATGREEE
ncbi:MAG: hypothetical protein ABWX67_13040 [Allosphingosinicella sp.]